MTELPRQDPIPAPALRRISLYLRQLEQLDRKGRKTLSSQQLGESLGLTDAQVRKDLAYLGQFGRPGIGYRVAELITRLRQILGTDRTWPVVLIGAGNLGRALSSYHGFSPKGFHLVALLDSDPGKFGQTHGELTVRPLGQLDAVVQTHQVKLAILAVPGEVAQDIANRLIRLGVRGILNFAPVNLNVPPEVSVNHVDLAVQLEQLAFSVWLNSSVSPAADRPPGSNP